MSEAKHTPGPWTNNYVGAHGHIIRGRDANKQIANVLVGFNVVPTEEAKANARLIGAAPDLLKACHAAYNALKSYQYGNTSPDLAESVADSVMVTIAKAEGR